MRRCTENLEKGQLISFLNDMYRIYGPYFSTCLSPITTLLFFSVFSSQILLFMFFFFFFLQGVS